ncbi:hypothetical protein EXIGLDRAFT_693800 [Exidia glandulosa HHB12029]|uniref:Uncharacterized protein n=1 Tax=Exidia glandulosa HHB12029 TaxID=1314781 RepID=A0A165NPD2_EXIGL|nr:hypothetical protein EXIGLDRAFT_693800 [Exidia glandulosa HHB12029]
MVSTRSTKAAAKPKTRSSTGGRQLKNSLDIQQAVKVARSCKACSRVQGKPVPTHGRNRCPLKASEQEREDDEAATAAALQRTLETQVDKIIAGRTDSAKTDEEVDMEVDAVGHGQHDDMDVDPEQASHDETANMDSPSRADAATDNAKSRRKKKKRTSGDIIQTVDEGALGGTFGDDEGEPGEPKKKKKKKKKTTASEDAVEAEPTSADAQGTVGASPGDDAGEPRRKKTAKTGKSDGTVPVEEDSSHTDTAEGTRTDEDDAEPAREERAASKDTADEGELQSKAKRAPKKPKTQSAIPNGWKGTSAGGAGMTLQRNRTLEGRFAEAEKRRCKLAPKHDTTPLFESIVLKAEWMSDLVPSWVFVAALPKGGLGELRTWHSETIETDRPGMPQRLRDIIFEELKGARVQNIREELASTKKMRAEKEKQEQELRQVHEQLAELLARNEKLERKMKKLRQRAKAAST